MALNALGRHVVLVGFMGSGKTSLGRQLGERLARSFLDLDVPSDGFLHQPMGGALLRLTKFFESGTGFVVKFDAHGGRSHVCLIDCKWNGEYMLWSQPRVGC